MKKIGIFLLTMLLMMDVFHLPLDSNLKREHQVLAQEITLPEASVSDFSYFDMKSDSGEDVVCIENYSGNEVKIRIPESVDGKKVYAITGEVFSGNEKIEEIYLPDTLEKLGSSAFQGCKNLKKVYLGSVQSGLDWRGLEWILNDCFALESISMSDRANFSIEYDSNGKFLSDGKTIFYNNGIINLKYLYIGTNMKDISIELFYGNNLEYIEIGTGNAVYKSVDGIVYSNDGKQLLVCPVAYQRKNVKISEGVERIKEIAFQFCNQIETVIIPESVRRVGFSSSEMKNLRTVVFQGDVPEDFKEFCSRFPDVKIQYPEKYKENYEKILFGKEATESGNQQTVHRHSYGDWIIKRVPTVWITGQRQKICTVCRQSITETIAKIKPSIKINVSSVKLKVRQSTTSVKAYGLAKGDSIKSWKSSNKKIVSVNKRGKISAGSKTGKATITIILKSGLKKKIRVTVQKKAVACTKIKLNQTKITLKKRKSYKIKPEISPITCVQKASYKSSNCKVATVTKTGKIVAKKKGRVTITVKVGRKTKKIKVTIK